MSARVHMIAPALAERARNFRLAAYRLNERGAFAEADTHLARARRLEECVAHARTGIRVIQNDAPPAPGGL